MNGARRKQARFSHDPSAMAGALYLLWWLVRPSNRREAMGIVAILTFEAVALVWSLAHIYEMTP